MQPPPQTEASKTTSGEDHTIHDAVMKMLNDSGVAFRVVHHASSASSEESAKQRGTPLECGLKALVVEESGKQGQVMVAVVAADHKADLKALRDVAGCKRLSLVGEETLWSKWKLKKGSVPPLGTPLGVTLWLDSDAGTRGEDVAFNVGLNHVSVVMRAQDYIKLEQHQRKVGKFSTK